MSGYAMIDMVAYIGQSFPNEAARRQHRVWVFCGIQNVESCQGVICGKSTAERSTNYPLLHSTAENPHFHGSQNNRSLTLYNICVTDALQQSSVPQSLPSVFFVVRLPKNRVLFFTILINFKVSSTLQQVSYHFTGRYDWLQFV